MSVEFDEHLAVELPALHTKATKRGYSKAEAATAMRVAGATWSDICFALDFSSDVTARRAVERELSNGVSAGEKEEHREMSALRYEKLLLSVWPVATDPDHPDWLPAQRQAKDLVDRLVALHGAAAPQEILVRNPAAKELAAFVARVTSASLPAVEEDDPFALSDGKPRVVDADVVEDASPSNDGA